MTHSSGQQDKEIRRAFNGLIGLPGMSTYITISQIAAENGMTAEEVRESLKRTEWSE